MRCVSYCDEAHSFIKVSLLAGICALGAGTSLRPHLFCHLFSHHPPSFLLKVLTSKHPWGEAIQLFNTLPPHEVCTFDINRVVNHRDWNTALLTQLSSFFILLSWADPAPLTTPDYQSLAANIVLAVISRSNARFPSWHCPTSIALANRLSTE